MSDHPLDLPGHDPVPGFRLQLLRGESAAEPHHILSDWRSHIGLQIVHPRMGVLAFQQVGRRWLQAGPGQLALLPPGVQHRYRIHQTPIRCDWIECHFTLTTGQDVASLADWPLVIDDPLSGERLQALCTVLPHSSSQPEPSGSLQRQAALAGLLAGIMQRLPGTDQRLREACARGPFQDLLIAMAADPAAAWSVARMAAQIGVGRSRLHQLFVSRIGLPPQRHLLRLRLHRAAELLAEGDRPVGEIACLVGFGDPFHFSRSFKNHWGCSPTAFRQQGRRSGLWSELP